MAQCEATAKSTGERCKKDAIPGANVCHVHGGNASQVREKAQERLDRMADTTTAEMQDKVADFLDLYDDADAETKVAILREARKVWTDILDRTGHGPSETREIESDDPLAEVVVDFENADT